MLYFPIINSQTYRFISLFNEEQSEAIADVEEGNVNPRVILDMVVEVADGDGHLGIVGVIEYLNVYSIYNIIYTKVIYLVRD